MTQSLLLLLANASPSMVNRLERVMRADARTLSSIDAALDGSVSSGERRSGSPARLVTYRDASERLGVSKRTVRRMASRGSLVSVSIGTRRRILATSIDSYIVSHENAASSNA